MDIFLTNNLTNKKEKFVPKDQKHIGMYVCGPTVYDDPHIGNARPLVIFDVLFKLLKNTFSKVTYVRNITDIDDKIIKSSQEQKVLFCRQSPGERGNPNFSGAEGGASGHRGTKVVFCFKETLYR